MSIFKQERLFTITIVFSLHTRKLVQTDNERKQGRTSINSICDCLDYTHGCGNVMAYLDLSICDLSQASGRDDLIVNLKTILIWS